MATLSHYTKIKKIYHVSCWFSLNGCRQFDQVDVTATCPADAILAAADQINCLGGTFIKGTRVWSRV